MDAMTRINLLKARLVDAELVSAVDQVLDVMKREGLYEEKLPAGSLFAAISRATRRIEVLRAEP